MDTNQSFEFHATAHSNPVLVLLVPLLVICLFLGILFAGYRLWKKISN
jgi:hypothetical protein